jgi:hypothetical protein
MLYYAQLSLLRSTDINNYKLSVKVFHKFAVIKIKIQHLTYFGNLCLPSLEVYQEVLSRTTTRLPGVHRLDINHHCDKGTVSRLFMLYYYCQENNDHIEEKKFHRSSVLYSLSE